MKKITFMSLTVATLMFGGLMTFNSCSKDDACKDVTCDHGTLVSDASSCSCNCDAGYFGTGCSSRYIDAFLATDSVGADSYWSVTEYENGNQNYAYLDTFSASTTAANVLDVAFTGSVSNTLTVDSTYRIYATDTFSHVTSNQSLLKVFNFTGQLNTAHNRIDASYDVQVDTSATVHYTAIYMKSN